MTRQRSKRSWGIWTEAKLGILSDYLPAFLRASKGKASEFVYLDAFAGQGEGVSRITGDEFPGSAQIALDVDEAGGFTKLRYFEKEATAAQLEQRLSEKYPGRDLKVYGGDCNDRIPEALEELRPFRWAPTFAFLDPDGMQLAWKTLKALADHKRGYKKPGSQEFKVEQWILFPTQGLIRVLALDERRLLPAHEDSATRLFGTQEWRAIYNRRRKGEMTAADAKEEYVNLMRWRLRDVLGYAKTHPFELKNMRGRTLYHMIFATDHPAGDQIMSDLYRSAADSFPEMQQEARDRERGQGAFELGDVKFAGPSYEYEDPWRPT